MKWYPRTCPVCGGDTHDDLEDKGWVTCFMCARSFAAKDVLAIQQVTRLPSVKQTELPEAA